jgi:hypothetical protein
MSLATHRPVTQALETFAREHLGNHESPLFRKQQEIFLARLQEKQAEWLVPHDNEGAYGMSGAGSCLLKQDLSRDGVKGTPVPGWTKTTWHLGHLIEVITVSILETLGCVIEGTQAPVRTYRADGSLLHSSKVDGIIVSAPAELQIPVPIILSVKSTAYKMAAFVKGGNQKRKGFAALPFGVKSEEPSWYMQAQLEMHGAGEWRQKCIDARALSLGWVPKRWDGTTPQQVLLVAVAKDVIAAYSQDEILQDAGSMAFHAEILKYEPHIATQLVNARQVFDHIACVPVPDGLGVGFVRLPDPGSPGGQNTKGFSIWGGPNQGATGTFNPCGMCEFKAHCAATYGKGAG